MDEIEYKLNTNNSVLIVNAIDKLLSTIKSKYKPGERQKFVLENEELKFLREKCSSEDNMVSLTACQGLLALVELGVLEIAHTMSTVVTLLPSTHNYSAIISTMAGLLILDLKSRLIPGQPYKCQFSMRSPQHPFITVLEKNKGMEDNVIAQMHALCTHPEYTVASNSLELLRPVFLWLTSSPQGSGSVKSWQLLLSLPESAAQTTLIVACLSCQQMCSPLLSEHAFSAYRAVSEAALHARPDFATALLPVLARASEELVAHGRDPRACYSLIERCVSEARPQPGAALAVLLLGRNLAHTSALYLHELFHLCLNIITKYEYSTLCLNSFVALSLQWLHLPSYLTNNALKVASKILEIQQNDNRPDTGLFIANLKSNAIFQELVHVDKKLYIYVKLLDTWERVRDDDDKLKSWFDGLTKCNDQLKLELLPFFVGLIMDKHLNYEVILKALRVVIDLVKVKKEISVTVLPILLYKIANDSRPNVKLECLRGLPLMATTKENVPSLVSILNKLKSNKGIPTSLLIMMYTTLAETQVRCFPYLQELLVDSTLHPNDLKWEVDIAKAIAVKRICEIRPSTQGVELVPVVSSLLSRAERSGCAPAAVSLGALALLWRGAAVAPPGAWRALKGRLAGDHRVAVQLGLCELLSEVPSLRVSTPEYDELLSETSSLLWRFLSEAVPETAAAAARALAAYRVEDYTLKNIPEVYRRTVKLPPSYCKTPSDAARSPEDMLDYVPCEVWPEVFKYTVPAALPAVQQLVSKLIEREVRGYRSGVYAEREGARGAGGGLPAPSALRGVLEGLRKQMVSPTYDYSDAVLLSMLEAISAEYPKPLPPFDFSFLHEGLHRGAPMRALVIKMSARQAGISVSAKRLVENFLSAIDPGNCEVFLNLELKLYQVINCSAKCFLKSLKVILVIQTMSNKTVINIHFQESDILLFFEYLPILCRTMSPNNLRPPLERCLAESFSKVRVTGQEDIFIKQFDFIRECLECDKIHDANRTLLSQFIENYFSVIDDDHVAWGAMVRACSSACATHVERMTSPSGWWETSGVLLRKACVVRAAWAGREAGGGPVWINEVVDAVAGHVAEQEFSLRCFLPALQAADVNAASTREWFLQLMARTQVAFKETDDESAKLYLCDVFFLSVIVFSNFWSFEPTVDVLLTSRDARLALVPAAVAVLMERDGWKEITLQMLEWLCHSRAVTRHAGVSRCCGRAVLGLRHTDAYNDHRIWMKLENNFNKLDIYIED